MNPDVQYVKTSDGAHIAYQVFGQGAFDLVFVPGFAYNVEHAWRLGPVSRAYQQLAAFARVVVFDRRGTGLSDRIDEASPPTLDARMDDIRAVMDAAGVERAVLLGYEDGANLCAVFAASNPSRVLAAVLHGSASRGMWAPDYPWAWRADEWDDYLDRIDSEWGTQEFADFVVEWAWPSQVGDATFRREWASFLRQSASPGAAGAFERLARDTDVRDVLGTIQVPVLVTHRVGDKVEPIECARELANQIPGARLVELPGADSHVFAGDVAQLLDAVERFVVSVKDEEVDVDRVLATILFTDMVGSTETAATIGDRAWRALVTTHDQRVRTLLGRYRGREVDRAGDGFFAIFDGPARAVRCALAIGEALEPLGVTVRAGVHTGEVELDGADVRGIAVNIGARVAASAGTGEVLVSSTVKDLVAGSGLGFESRGTHALKGIPDEWELYAAVPWVTEPLV